MSQLNKMSVKTQLRTDKWAMTLSFVCALHCLLVPSFFILTSGFFAISIDNEFIHYFILFFAVPISSYALITGYRNHNTLKFLIFGFSGLFLLIFAVMFSGILYGEFGEKCITLLGSILVIYSHYKNYQTCKSIDCSCHEE
tara:strand:- start:178 stop:600 length:423 start_codon:yes stop_codon:yes gene_type:complete